MNKTTESVKIPDWFANDLVIPFGAGIGNVFIVYGDLNCLIPNINNGGSEKSYISLRQFFEKVFRKREIVIFYSISSGPRFQTPEMEKKFKKIAGIEVDEDVAAKDAVTAAKLGLSQKRGIPREPESCFPLIEKVLRSAEGVAVIINSVHFIAPASSGGITLPPNERINIERLKNWGQDEEIRDKGNIVLFLTDQLAKISNELRQSGDRIHTVFIAKPSKEERKAFIKIITEGTDEYRELQKQLKELQKILKKTNKSSKNRGLIEREIGECQKKLSSFSEMFLVAEDFDLESFSLATQGMNLEQVLEIFLHSKKTGKPVDIEYVKIKKKEILNNEYGEVMEVVEPEKGLEDIGGLEHVKTYLKEVLEAIKNGESRLVPMGITLMGPPGTGKTAIVEALAKEAGFNFVKTRNIRSMWVGESEARMEKLTNGLKSLAPVVVMNDEADLAEASRDSYKGDSGVSERLMKMWMELLSDPKIRGKIIVISCTNRPDRIDPALKRSGRSDDRILLPMPSKEERAAIFRVMFKRYKIPMAISDFTDYAELSNDLSGANIEKIVLDAYRFAFKNGKKEVDDEILREAIGDSIPSASQMEIDRMTLMGILDCSSRRLLPPHIKEIIVGIQKRRLVENLDEIIAQIKTRNIVEIGD